MTRARLVALLALACVLVLPHAAALDARVDLARAPEGAWNGRTLVTDATPGATVLAWLPEGARVQAVTTDAGAPAWRAAAPDALAVTLPENATRVAVTYDFQPTPPRLATVRAPEPYARLDLRVEGAAVVSDDAAFQRQGDVQVASLVGVDRDARVDVLLRDAASLTGAQILAVVAASALVAWLAAQAWHAWRPPLGGREAQRLMEHLGELQARLVPVAVAFALLNLLYFTIGVRATTAGWPLPVAALAPGQSLSAQAFDAFAHRLVPEGVQLVALRPVEAVLAQVQVTLFLAFVAVLPLLAHEAAAFLAPALRPRERRVARSVLPVLVGLFAGGALFGFTQMAPLLIRTLYAYAPGLGARPLLAVSDLVAFALLVMLAFAVAFELPVAMYGLARLGLVRAATFGRYVRHAVLVIVLAAGVLTPDPSVVSQLFVAVPVTGLYLVGIVAARWGESRRPEL